MSEESKKTDSKPTQIQGKEDFDKVVSEGLTLVDFWATWCGPCRMIAPVLEKLAPEFEGKIEIAKLRLDEDDAAKEQEHQQIAASFGIQGIPTMLVFLNGEIVEDGRIVGAVPEPMLKAKLEDLWEQNKDKVSPNA